MSRPIVNSPFKSAIGAKTIPQRGSKGGGYDNEVNDIPAGLPGRTTSPNCPPLLHRDAESGAPSTSGPITHSPFAGAVTK